MKVAATNLVNSRVWRAWPGTSRAPNALPRRTRDLARHGSWADAAVALHGLGQLELRRGDYPAARVALREALAIYVRTGPIADELAVAARSRGALAAAGDCKARG